MATYTALVLLELDLDKEPSLSDTSKLQEILASATRRFAKVMRIVFLQPGEEVKVTPTAAEGEEAEMDKWTPFILEVDEAYTRPEGSPPMLIL